MAIDEPVRILRIIARLNIGGPAIQAVTLSAKLPRDTYRTLLVCGRVGAHEGDMSYLGVEEGIRPLILPGLGREISPLDDLRSFGELKKVIRDFKPHIVHTHTAKAGTLGRLAGMYLNGLRGGAQRIRLVHTFHGHVFQGYFNSPKTFVFIQIERFLARFTDRIVVISPLQRADICRRYRICAPEKAQVIPLGFYLDPFRDVRRIRARVRTGLLSDCGEDVLIVGIIGRLTPIKNHRMLLESVRHLKDWGRGESFRVVVVGDGELRQELLGLSRELGIADHVVFAGWQKDMPSVYGAIDGVALTSLNEGTPVALIEAMAAGIPVIATAVGGVPDLLGDVQSESDDGYRIAQRGMLVRSGDAEGLARGLLFLLENRGAFAETSVRARDFAFRRYTMERLVKDMDALYRQLLGCGSSASR